MKGFIFDITKIRMEISFKTISDLRSILSFYQRNNLNKINIPCKNCLKKDFLLDSIKISKLDFPNIDVIPHFSILHEFKRNRFNTLNSLINFLNYVKELGCNEVLLVSGSQKRSTLDSSSALHFLKDNTLFSNNCLSIGVAFNPYLPSLLFEEEVLKLKKKLKSGLVKSIWIQFGTDFKLLESRIEILKNIISSSKTFHTKKFDIVLYGSILIPSKQFIARYRYRPWKGVYCSDEFLNSINLAQNIVIKLLKTYKIHNICPIIETEVSSADSLKSLQNMLAL